MSIIHTYLTRSEVKRLSNKDTGYLKNKLDTKCMLNKLLNKPVNRPLLTELRCVLDSKPVARRKTERRIRNSKVKVYSPVGKLIRIEHGTGKVMKQLL